MTIPWNPEQLAQIGALDEISVAPDHADGRPGDPVIVWAVASGDALYVRSARGPEGGWYRRALASGRGRIEADGRSYEVIFSDAAVDADHAALDAAYHEEYDRYGSADVDPVVGEASHRVTVRIDPAAPAA